MLFYESAACLHGRRHVLKGRYYASVFVHYQPVDPAVWNFSTEVSESETESTFFPGYMLGFIVLLFMYMLGLYSRVTENSSITLPI